MRICFGKLFCSIWLILFMPLPTFASESTISWKVINRFPLFISNEQGSPFEKLEDHWNANQSASDFLASQNSISLRELLPIHRTLWNRESGTYNREEFFKDTHQVKFQLDSVTNSQGLCQWQLNGVVQQTAKCHIPFISTIPENEYFNLEVSQGNTQLGKLYEKIETQFILALGDEAIL